MAFCLPSEFTDKFLNALKDGTIDPAKLADMSSAERREMLGKIVGDDNAKDVNALLESKLLLKNQQAGLVTWAKQVAGITEPQRRDFISRIEKLDRVLNPADEKAFLSDLAAQKLGATVTADEARTISEGAKNVQALKAKIPDDAPIGSEDRMAYGLALDEYHSYMNHLMGREAPTLKDVLTHPSKWFGAVASSTKGILSSFDNSFFGRQGLKMLFTNPDAWAKRFGQSWVDGAKQLRDIDVMHTIRADILSRPNALNGKYKAMGADVGIDFEEAFPSSLPERIPVLGRLYKASETMFNGAALRLRADYADKIIGLAERNGLDMTNPDQARPLGQLTNSMTGRGEISIAGQPLPPAWSKAINATFFSLKFLKSNYDTLTGHSFGMFVKDPATRAFLQKQAAINLAKIAAGVSAILMTAKAINPDSTDFDPRSSLFGKIKIGQTTIDVTAGMGPLITLAARLITNETKNSTTGKITELGTGTFGSRTRMDVIDDFFLGRLSPIAGAIRDWWKGENFQGQKPTLASTAANLVTPLPFQTMMQSRNEPDAGMGLAATIADFLGFNANPPNPTGLDLGARDPVELELVRLGFTSRQVLPHTGNSEADGYITEELTPIADKNLRNFFASKGYASMTEPMKQAVTKNMLKGAENAAKQAAFAAHPQFFIKLRQEAAAQKHPALVGAAP